MKGMRNFENAAMKREREKMAGIETMYGKALIKINKLKWSGGQMKKK